ncbi:MAG: amino acid ABC transporter substrate-binding protein [Thermodesulfobacteria bacterium]|nr:amino acid ABC transporter substrate-binding protein [Thermodesulfobacteriota bacterium]
MNGLLGNYSKLLRNLIIFWVLAAFLLILPEFSLAETQVLPVVKIGALLDLSGPLSNEGTAAYKSLQYAVEEINLQGGVGGRSLEVIVFDTASDETRLLSGAYQLLDEGAIVLVGPTSPGNCLTLRRFAENKHIPLVLIAGTSPVLTFSGIKTRWTFSVTENFASELKALFSIFRRRGYRSIGVVVQAGNFYKELFLWIRGYAPEYGLRVTCAEGFNLNSEDISRKISYMNRCDPDVALLWADSQAKSLIFPELSRADTPVAISHTLLDFGAFQGANDMYGLFLVAIPAPLAPVGLQKGLSFGARNFLARWGSELAAMKFDAKLAAAQAWDAAHIIALALKKGGIRGRSYLRSVLEGRIKSYWGVMGRFSFDKRDHSGLDPKSLLLLRYFRGRWSWLK